MTLAGARVLVVGGGSGIGFAVAEAARGQGAVVTLASTNEAKLRVASVRLGGVETAVLDITDEEAVAQFFRQSLGYDHIVSTAGDWGGPGRRCSFAEMDLADAQALFGVRFWGAAKLAKHGARALAEGGSLTLTSGLVALRPRKGTVMATAVAGSIGHLVHGLAVELAPTRVNGVFPGHIATERTLGLSDETRRAEAARYVSHPLPRIGQPSEIAEAYLYLMKCTYVTGQILQVDGGAMFPG